jgi:hypothetical protein
VTAARLFGAAQATRSQLRTGTGIFGPYWTAQQARVRALIGDAAFDAAYAEGASYGLDEAAAVAMAVDYPDLAAGSPRFTNVP